MERRQAIPVSGVHVRAPVHQKPNDVQAALLRSHVKRRPAIPVSAVHVRAPVRHPDSRVRG